MRMLYDPHRRIAYGARVAGVSEEVERVVRDLEIQIHDDDTIHADLLIRGRGILVSDVEGVADRLYPPLLALARAEGVTCFLAAPLKSSQRMMGFIAADPGQAPCRQSDLELLKTIAAQIAVALDNAEGYHELEELTQSLERRVQERTRELQTANDKLQELDRLKSVFVSIVSHGTGKDHSQLHNRRDDRPRRNGRRISCPRPRNRQCGGGQGAAARPIVVSRHALY